jgi:hypothetical protein
MNCTRRLWNLRQFYLNYLFIVSKSFSLQSLTPLFGIWYSNILILGLWFFSFSFSSWTRTQRNWAPSARSVKQVESKFESSSCPSLDTTTRWSNCFLQLSKFDASKYVVQRRDFFKRVSVSIWSKLNSRSVLLPLERWFGFAYRTNERWVRQNIKRNWESTTNVHFYRVDKTKQRLIDSHQIITHSSFFQSWNQSWKWR